jgi:hypothetical protein
MADQVHVAEAEGNRAVLIARIRSLAPALLPADPSESTEDLRWLLTEIEQQIADFAAAGFVDQAE